MHMNKLLIIFIVSMLAFTSCTVKEIQPTGGSTTSPASSQASQDRLGAGGRFVQRICPYWRAEDPRVE